MPIKNSKIRLSKSKTNGSAAEQTDLPLHQPSASAENLASVTLMRLMENKAVPPGQRQALLRQGAGQLGNHSTSQLVTALKSKSNSNSNNGNTAIQRCGCGPTPTATKCACDEKQGQEVTPVQREPGGGGGGEKAPNCGPGTSNPFCLPIPNNDGPCKPFVDVDHAVSIWANLSNQIPIGAAAATGCSEVKPVWEAYFEGTSKPFAFSNPGSCVVQAAKTDPDGSRAAKDSANGYFKNVVDQLPNTLRGVQPSPFSLDGHLATLRLPLEEAIGPHGTRYLHPPIVYNHPFNAAANIAGAVGTEGEGSDVFGDDDRKVGGPVIIEVDAIDPVTGMMSGEVRWQPHVHAKDTVDFCPGNMGNSWQQSYTVPMSKLEASGLTKDVPITIDYDLETHTAKFNVIPLIGPLPLPPKPGPGPKPKPKPTAFPRSGPAKTTGSLLRVRKGPGLNFTTLGLLGERGTAIHVKDQVHGDKVKGNDVWDEIDGGFVAHHYVAFDFDEVLRPPIDK
jgi:hypothetical protein